MVRTNPTSPSGAFATALAGCDAAPGAVAGAVAGARLVEGAGAVSASAPRSSRADRNAAAENAPVTNAANAMTTAARLMATFLAPILPSSSPPSDPLPAQTP